MARKQSNGRWRRIGLVLCGGALALALVADACSGREAASAGSPHDADRMGDRVVLDLRDGTTKAQYDAAEKRWGVDVEFNSIAGAASGIVVGTVSPARLEAVLDAARADPLVERAEPLYRYRASWVPNDPQFGAQWNLEMIGMREAWDSSRGKGVTVAVIDTGIAYEDQGEFKRVPDLAGARFASGYDFVNDDTHPTDDHGHGTHVAGTIAQVTDNREGVAGVAFEATLMPVKVLDANGTGTSADIADAIRWAADHGARVLNLSLGGGGRSEVLAAAVSYARAKGAVVVCAAGNGGRGVVEFPAAYPGALAVSAVGPSGELAFYSSWGRQIALAAPGGDKRKDDRGGVLQNTIADGDPSRSRYAWFQGTSMATPHVAGVAALLFAAGARSPDAVERALFEGAKARGAGWNERYGYGVLDASGALAALAGTRPNLGKRLFVLLAAALLWLLTRSSLPAALRRTLRPSPGLLLAAAVTVLGFFFLPWLGAGRIPGLAVLARPLPDWGGAWLGTRALDPLFYSALVPVLAALAGFRKAGARGLITGLALGFAAMLLVRAVEGGTSTSLLWRMLGAAWLLVNAVLALLVARAAMHHQAGGTR